MNEHNARLIVIATVLACIGVAVYHGKNANVPYVRTVIGCTIVGGALYALAPVVPKIVVASCALLLADLFVLNQVGGGISIVNGIATAVAEPKQKVG